MDDPETRRRTRVSRHVQLRIENADDSADQVQTASHQDVHRIGRALITQPIQRFFNAREGLGASVGILGLHACDGN